MANNSEKNLHHQQEAGNAQNGNLDRVEQFNELSEISLEERMAVADQIGIPVDNVGDAAATGAMRGSDDKPENSENQMEEENTGEEIDR
jgi:hypothetical protein